MSNHWVDCLLACKPLAPDSVLCAVCTLVPQTDLAAAESKRTTAESQLSASQADAQTAKSELTKLQQQLSSTTSSLETTQSKLSRAESDLSAAKAAADEAAGAGSSCKLSLKKAESRITEQSSRLEELKAVEEALLPVWLSRRLIQAQTFTAVQVCACTVALTQEVALLGSKYALSGREGCLFTVLLTHVEVVGPMGCVPKVDAFVC